MALTFDDGYLQHYDIARLLHALHIRATFFLITGLQLWNRKTLLAFQPSLIRKIRDMKHEIGSHTSSHPNLVSQKEEEVEGELCKSKEYLEKVLGQEVAGFAYPYGKYDDFVKSLAAKHYRYARAARESHLCTDDKYELPIRGPGRNLGYCSLSMTQGMIRGDDFAVLLLHSIPERSVRVWTTYLKAFRVNFLTLGELVDARYT